MCLWNPGTEMMSRWRFDMRAHLAVTSQKKHHEGVRTRDIQVGNRGSEAASEEQPDKLRKTVRLEQGAPVHTPTCGTHIFLRTAPSLRPPHIFMRVTHTHGSRLKCHEKGFGRMRMSFSISPSTTYKFPRWMLHEMDGRKSRHIGEVLDWYRGEEPEISREAN